MSETNGVAAVDTPLAEGLGPAAADILCGWAKARGLRFELDRWPLNGRSKAKVAVVVRHGVRTAEVRKLILKLAAGPADMAESEYARHDTAVRENVAFAARHFARIDEDLIPVGDGTWITFQQPAGDLARFEVPTAMLYAIIGKNPPRRGRDAGPKPTPADFTQVCTSLIRGVLTELAEQPSLARDQPTVTAGQFLLAHLGDQLTDERRLKPGSRRNQGPFIQVRGEDRPLPNPFALARSELPVAALSIRALVGRTHGDLHTDNALVRVGPEIKCEDYYLIDNALYESEGPLTRDPVHFLLYIVARTTDALSELQLSSLIDVLLNPAKTPRGLLPGWLEDSVRDVIDVAEDWVEQYHMSEEWRQQTLLSLIGCALLYTGRTSTADQDWFLRLAARATAEFVSEYGGDLPAAPVDAESHPAPAREWIGHLCTHLPETRARATAPAHASVARRIIESIGAGGDPYDEYCELMRRLGGPQPGPRLGTPGAEGSALTGEVYRCPMALCERCDRREPGGAVPHCELARALGRSEQMHREFR